jgi:hypothetical protein
MANKYKTMQNNFFSNLNGFPTDNSPSTQLKYDIVASKFMTGIENHHKRNAPVSIDNDLGLVGAVLQIIVALVVIVGAVLHWIWKRL